MVAAYQGTVQNGQIHFEEQPDLEEGAQVIVVVVGEDHSSAERKSGTLGDMLKSPAIGMWADREDITDSAEYARHLREKASQRSGE